MTAKLFGTRHYVCGGHGAIWPSDGGFVVPQGITIHFYIPDGAGLPNNIGQQIDQVLAGGSAPTPTETIRAGAPCNDYRLFSSKAGGYLNLAMSSSADHRYITETRQGRRPSAQRHRRMGDGPDAECGDPLERLPLA